MAHDFFLSLLLCVLFFLPYVASQQPALPGYVPLALRSPYFNCWVNGQVPMKSWPTFWNQAILGWAGIVRVDGTAYEWLGNGNPALNVANLTALTITPTRTIYTMQAGAMEVNITFLTPIEESDLVKQSMPFSYFYIDAVSTDGQTHSVQVYTDISAEWSSGNRSEIVTWQTTKTDTSTFHSVQLVNPSSLVETKDQAEDTTTIIAMRSGPSVSTTIANDVDSRGGFAKGQLPGPVSDTQGIINNPFKVFAIATDLGTISQTSESVTWAVGVLRNPVIAYRTPSGAMQNRSPYFMTKYPDFQSAVDAFLLDFDNARSHAFGVDDKIMGAASSVSSQLPNIISLVARQAIGATELTVSNGTDGNWNTTDVKMFMKNVGVDSRVNPVEIIYQSFPFFLFVSPKYAGYLLSPLLEYQDSPQYTQPYAATDLGQSYPQATGDNRQHIQGIEQSGNMLIMSWAHAQSSGDGTYINQHYDLLKSWANWLANNTLTPNQQNTADLESNANLTNLAVKGILGIEAMHQISQALGKTADAGNFATTAASLASTWSSLATASDGSHLLATYDNGQSWTLPYNLYADKMMQSKLIGSNVYDEETSFFKQLLSTTGGLVTPFGIPLDTLVTTQTDAGWLMFMAAAVTDPSVRDSLLQPIWTHITSAQSTFPASKVYKLDTTGAAVNGQSSPGLGAAFASLAMNLQAQQVSVPPPVKSASSSKKTSIVGPVVGGVVGGLALIALALLAVLFWRRRRRILSPSPSEGKIENLDNEFRPTPNPAIAVYSLPLGGTRTQLNNAGTQSREMLATTPATTTVTSSESRSSKAQEAARGRYQTSPSSPLTGNTTTPSASSYSNPVSNSGSSNPPSSREPPSDIVSSSDVQGLRAEVANLRRAMEEIQLERTEAPPSYFS